MKSKKMLRGKKRYIVFKLCECLDSKNAHLLIYSQLLNCFGTFGMENAGYRFFKERFDEKNGTGIVRLNNEKLNDARRAFKLIENKITIIGVSGIIKKTARFLPNRENNITAKKPKFNDSKK